MAGCKEARYKEVRDEMVHMLLKVGWKKDFVNQSVPVLPISGWMGDNLINKSTKMDWWKGVDIKVDKETLHIDTLKEALEKMVRTPDRPTDKPMRTPISGGFKIKGLNKDNMPRVGDVMVLKTDSSVNRVKNF